MENAWPTVLTAEKLQGTPRGPFSTSPKHPTGEPSTCRTEKDVHSNGSIRYIFASNCPQTHKLHLKQKSPIKQSFENTYFLMVVKYGNKISLMKTQISSICCKVSTNGLYGLDFLCHILVTILTSVNALGM